jgi:hypothetical protein
MSKCWTKLLCVCHDLQQEVQDNPHFLTKGITSNGKWDYGHDPETEQLFSQHECSDYGGSAHRISPSQIEVSLSGITQVCHGLHRWSTAKWQMETGSLWQLICSYNLMYPAVHGKKKKKGATPPTSVPVWTLIHVIYSCFQRWNWSAKKSYTNICRLYLIVLQRMKFKHDASDNGRIMKLGIWTP